MRYEGGIEHVLCAISNLSHFLKNYVNVLKQIVWETKKNGIKILVGQAVHVLLIKTLFCTFGSIN